MEQSNLISSTSINSYPENQSKSEEKRKIKRLKNERAISDLREKIPDIDNIFNIHSRIGNGTFSTVLLATLKCDEKMTSSCRKMFAVKHLIPTCHPLRIEKELKCLVDIGGVDNVVGIDLCLRRQESVAFVMPYLQHDHFQEYFDKMDVREVQMYMRNLLIALKRVHSFNVIHRDVKPSNFLHNRKSEKYMLVDFGLAQTVRPELLEEKNRKRKASEKMDSPDVDNESKRQKTIKSIEDELLVSSSINYSSSFKMPLKQLNEIIPPKASLNKFNLKYFDSPLTRQVKSVILGVSMTSRLQEQHHAKSAIVQQNLVKEADMNVSPLSQPKYNTNKNLKSSSVVEGKCYCYGKNQVCNICLIKKDITAARAGTPGYRPPEVLLKYAAQTTAVDMWAVGVIFISILSAVYPFFKAPDDFLALAEIVTIFGDETIRRTAFALNRHICMSRKCKPLDLRRLCIRLRNRFKINRAESEKNCGGERPEECVNCQQRSYDCLCVNTKYKVQLINEDDFPVSAYALLGRLLEVNPYKRITAEEALQHPFFDENV